MLQPSPKSIAELVAFVRKNSPFFQKLYEGLPENISDIAELPLIDIDRYTEASALDNSQVLTGPIVDGGIFRSGGTTNNPKVVYATRDELLRGVQMLAAGLSHRAGIVPGDRIANLTHAGEMYGGFVMQVLTLMEMATPHVHLPISGNSTPSSIAKLAQTFRATVTMSNVFTMCRLADYLVSQNQTIPTLRLILYTGESFYKDLRPLFKKAFPNATVGPLMYVSVDGGVIGLPARPPVKEDDDISPTYIVNQPTVTVQLLDEDGAVITENGKHGRVILTDLVRRLQPVIRYPMGDLAEWIDYDEGTFTLCGRESVAVKIGPLFLNLHQLRETVATTLGPGVVNNFQTIVRRMPGTNEVVAGEGQQSIAVGKNEVAFRIAHQPVDPEQASRLLEQNLIKIAPKWQEYLDIGYIEPLKAEWVAVKDLVFNERTGKLREIIEERFPQTA